MVFLLIKAWLRVIYWVRVHYIWRRDSLLMAGSEMGTELRLTVILESEEKSIYKLSGYRLWAKNTGLTVKLLLRNWGKIKYSAEWRKCGKRPSHQLTRMRLLSLVIVKTHWALFWANGWLAFSLISKWCDFAFMQCFSKLFCVRDINDIITWIWREADSCRVFWGP